MNAVVVAKTKMGQNICVGAVDVDSGALLRLIPRDGAEYHSWQEFKADIGDLITVNGSKASKVDPPHVEDYLVSSWKPTGKSAKNLHAWIRKHCVVWNGDRSNLFDGKLRFTSYGKGHVDRGDPLPAHSVGFWELPAPLELEPGEKKRYVMNGLLPVSAPFVGLEAPPAKCPKGAIVRVSLSRWWAPDDSDMPEACWLQISGVYLA